jgi:hypothetical protein
MERAEAVRTFEQALRRLQEVLREPESALVRDAAMNRCEFTFELAWKAVQRLLREPGVLCHSPKGCLREPRLWHGARPSTVDSDDRRPQSYRAYGQ